MELKFVDGIKVILAFLFFLCLLDLPYGYFQFVRFSALIGFAVLAYNDSKEGNKIGTVSYLALAILFQPFFKISLGRTIWNFVDIIVGISLIVSIFIFKKKRS